MSTDPENKPSDETASRTKRHLVTLIVEQKEGEDPPDEWDWAGMLECPDVVFVGAGEPNPWLLDTVDAQVEKERQQRARRIVRYNASASRLLADVDAIAIDAPAVSQGRKS